MRILITWILKGLVTITLGNLAQIGLVFLALIMWDEKFMDMSQDVTDTIWKKR
jgi:hypothetical protein